LERPYTIRRTVGNAVSILTSDVVNRATTFVLYALIARYLGPFEFGQMSLALTLFYTFQVLAVAGLKTLITREVARNKTGADQYLVNGTLVVAMFSLFSITILWLFVRLMDYNTETASIILLLSLGLVPYALSAICEAIFQAWERMHYIAYANMPVNIAKLSLAFVILSNGHGLYHLVILLLACHIAIVSIEWLMVLRYITIPRLRIGPRFSLDIIRATGAFLGMDSIAAITASFNFVLLSKMASETAVGLFSAASQLLVPANLFYQSVALSIFPVMCRHLDISFKSLKQISMNSIELLLAIALPASVSLFFLADAVLLLLYGKQDFLLASGVLRVMLWNLPLSALTSILGWGLVASLHEKTMLRIYAIDIIVSLGLCIILISRFGLMGAAIAALFAKIVDTYLHYIWSTRLLFTLALGRIIWKPLVASTFMAAHLAMMGSKDIFLTIISAGVVYASILLALVVWSSGGFHQCKARYLHLWSE
jgi:O-antigen/teichoic acid export membrane protein